MSGYNGLLYVYFRETVSMIGPLISWIKRGDS